MDLDMLEKKEMQHYFRLGEEIKQLDHHVIMLQDAFYSQTMTTRTMPSDTGIISVGFSQERNVIPYLESLSNVEVRKGRLIKKKRYLNDYLNTLKPTDCIYLTNKYSAAYVFGVTRQLDIELFDEINEINEAISYMYGYENDFPDITNLEMTNENVTENIDSVAKMLGV